MDDNQQFQNQGQPQFQQQYQQQGQPQFQQQYQQQGQQFQQQGQPTYYGQPQYNMPPYGAPQLKSDRGLLKFILFNLITCGIYSIAFFSSLGEDINLIASRRDGKKTMHYCLITFLFSWLTCGIAPIVWFHKVSARIGDEARARGINTSFGASSFWLWYVLGSLIVVGPFVYIHKLCETMNQIDMDYNRRGF